MIHFLEVAGPLASNNRDQVLNSEFPVLAFRACCTLHAKWKGLVTDSLSTDRFVTEMCFVKMFQQMANQSS